MHNATDQDLGTARPLGRALRNRYLILAILAAAAAVVAGGRGDWNVFVQAGQDLLHRDGLHFYARHGDIQTGPLSLLVAVFASVTPRNGFVFCVVASTVLGLVVLRLLEAAARRAPSSTDDRITTTTLLGGALFVFWWAKLGGYGHLDDALVLAAAIGALLLARRDRAFSAALLVGLAIGVKPWAVIFLPLAVMPFGHIRRRLSPVMLALAVGLVWWAPFIFFVPATIHSLRPTVNIAEDSVLALLGLHGDPPSWLRIVQLLGALAVGVLAMLRSGPAGVIWVAVAFRVGTDPGTWSYYTAGFVAGALAWDLLATRRTIPIGSIVASLLLLPPWIVGPAPLRAGLRLAACIGALIVVLSQRSSGPRRDPCDPKYLGDEMPLR